MAAAATAAPLAPLLVLLCLIIVGEAFHVLPGYRNYSLQGPKSLEAVPDADDNFHTASPTIDRRTALTWTSATALSVSTLSLPTPAIAADKSDAPLAPITHKVFMNVRISRSDGTFYVRDDEDDANPDSKVFYGKLVFGLFGKTAPTAVERFLSYVNVPFDDEAPLPSYSRSSFKSLDQSTGTYK